jgi:hypothetical protein
MDRFSLVRKGVFDRPTPQWRRLSTITNVIDASLLSRDWPIPSHITVMWHGDESLLKLQWLIASLITPPRIVISASFGL